MGAASKEYGVNINIEDITGDKQSEASYDVSAAQSIADESFWATLINAIYERNSIHSANGTYLGNKSPWHIPGSGLLLELIERLGMGIIYRDELSAYFLKNGSFVDDVITHYLTPPLKQFPNHLTAEDGLIIESPYPGYGSNNATGEIDELTDKCIKGFVKNGSQLVAVIPRHKISSFYTGTNEYYIGTSHEEFFSENNETKFDPISSSFQEGKEYDKIKTSPKKAGEDGEDGEGEDASEFINVVYDEESDNTFHLEVNLIERHSSLNGSGVWFPKEDNSPEEEPGDGSTGGDDTNTQPGDGSTGGGGGSLFWKASTAEGFVDFCEQNITFRAPRMVHVCNHAAYEGMLTIYACPILSSYGMPYKNEFDIRVAREFKAEEYYSNFAQGSEPNAKRYPIKIKKEFPTKYESISGKFFPYKFQNDAGEHVFSDKSSMEEFIHHTYSCELDEEKYQAIRYEDGSKVECKDVSLTLPLNGTKTYCKYERKTFDWNPGSNAKTEQKTWTDSQSASGQGIDTTELSRYFSGDTIYGVNTFIAKSYLHTKNLFSHGEEGVAFTPSNFAKSSLEPIPLVSQKIPPTSAINVHLDYLFPMPKIKDIKVPSEWEGISFNKYHYVEFTLVSNYRIVPVINYTSRQVETGTISGIKSLVGGVT